MEGEKFRGMRIESREIKTVEAYSMERRAHRKEKHNEANEDRTLVDAENGLFAVFDGMGGHDDGEVASQLALETIQEEVRSRPPKTIDEAKALVKEALEKAHAAIREENKRLVTVFDEKNRVFVKRQRNMGTTAVVLLILEVEGKSHAVIGHVGDSRANLLRKKSLRTLTLDDAWWLEQLGEQGYNKMLMQDYLADAETPSDIPKDCPIKTVKPPRGNVLSQAIGTVEDIEVHVTSHELEDGDVFLLETDGIHDPLALHRIEEILNGVPLCDVPRSLFWDVDRVNNLQDPITKKDHPRKKDDDGGVVAVRIHIHKK
jgi:serine/threonine protein phosphatase PrpC